MFDIFLVRPRRPYGTGSVSSDLHFFFILRNFLEQILEIINNPLRKEHRDEGDSPEHRHT